MLSGARDISYRDGRIVYRNLYRDRITTVVNCHGQCMIE